VTLAYALSLAALRRLRFPIGGNTTQEVDGAARCVLAALGLAAICLLDEDGFDLRSRCLLDGKPGTFEFVGRGETSEFDMDANGAAQLLADAAEAAKGVGLPWAEGRITLQPSPNLSRLVVESRRLSMAASAED
jgi:CRISPR-associated protein Csb1